MKHVNIAPLITLLRGLYDPRGRCNRYGLMVSAVLAVVFSYGSFATIHGFNFDSPLFWIVLAHALWINIVPCIRRGHDLGYRSLYILLGIPSLIVIGLIIMAALVYSLASWGYADIITPPSPFFFMIYLIAFAPFLSAALWLSVVKGQDCANEYGDIPVLYGLSHPMPHNYPIQDTYVCAAITYNKHSDLKR